MRHQGITNRVLSIGSHPNMSKSTVTLLPAYDTHPSRKHHSFLPCHCLNLPKIRVISLNSIAMLFKIAKAFLFESWSIITLFGTVDTLSFGRFRAV